MKIPRVPAGNLKLFVVHRNYGSFASGPYAIVVVLSMG